MTMTTFSTTTASTTMNTQQPTSHNAPSHFKPGQTVNKHERHFVVHDYHDYSNEPNDPSKDPIRRRKGGVTTPFPTVLHRTLQQIELDGHADVFGWQPHGRCFVIFQPKEFVRTIMPKYFKLGKLSSFQRQLNLYGFNRITRGKDATGYYHEYFLRHREYLTKRILRKRIKGTKIKGATNPDLEPDFYGMPMVGPHPDPHAVVAALPAPIVSSDDNASSSDGGQTNDDSASAEHSSSSRDTTADAPKTTTSTAAVCNFVFPKFQTTTTAAAASPDPVDALLQEHAADWTTTSPTVKEDWELQEAILGQYLIFDEEDHVEAV